MLYLMGFLPPEKVPNAILLTPKGNNKEEQCSSQQTPIEAEATTISINDIIKLYGPRTPSFRDAKKDFNIAFILLTRSGSEPSTISLNNIQRWAKGFPNVFLKSIEY
jgi:hypothetical protein